MEHTMDWTQIFISAGITGIMLSAVAWMIKRWIDSVDKKFQTIGDKLQDIELRLAALPSEFVLKVDFNSQREHDSKRRESLWAEKNELDRRVTVVETIVDLRKDVRRSKDDT